jgi:putative ABC transport system permease protein
MNIIQFLGALELGLIYGLVAVAVYLTFRIIDFPDLTVDGSFTLGAAVSASLIVKGVHPLYATLAAFAAGALSGVVTAYLHVRWHILGLLAGILTMTALYSINLRIMERPNIALLSEPTLFNQWEIPYGVLVILGIIVVCVIVLLTRFLLSQLGLGLRATGVNPRVSRSYGVNVGAMIIIALALSNAIVAFGGALFTQSQGFADISMGAGTIITGLASVIVGETVMRSRNIAVALVSCLVGSVLYRLAVAFALNAGDLGLKASDLNLITALLVAVTMVLPKLQKSFAKTRRS